MIVKYHLIIMYQFADLTLFLRIAETGNLSSAARDLGLLPATASASLKRIEQQLDCRLFERTTRSMRLTQQGELFRQYCATALQALADGEAALNDSRQALHGQLRISAPADWGRNVLRSWLDGFQAQHPQLGVTLQCSDYRTDLFRDPFDLAFRYGRLDDSTLIAQELAANERILVAAPAYLEKHGAPKTLDALRQHNCLLHNLNQLRTNIWRFPNAHGLTEITVSGNRVADDGGVVRAWAVDGQGIACKSALDVQEDLRAGRLVRILPQLRGPNWPLYAIYPHRDSVSPAVRAVIAYVRERLAR
jgi:DNA-binding transcriptional LysR family regulator